MEHLRLSLFQSFAVTHRLLPSVTFRTAHTRALLAYLAVEPGRTHRRETLAGLLWPDKPDRVALHNLSQTLVNLRASIGDRDASPPFLITTRQTVAFNPASDHWIDTVAFEAAMRAVVTHPHASLERCEPCLERLEQAAALYRGPFLADLTVGGSLFEEWALLARERLQGRAVELLELLVSAYVRCQRYRTAETYARQIVQIDPLREAAQRDLMQILALSGRRALALQQFEQWRALLWGELGVEPEPETVELASRMRAGGAAQGGDTPPAPATGQRGARSPASPPAALALRSPAGRLAAPPAVTQISGEPPDFQALYGRQYETATLSRWLVEEHCRVVALVGMGGVGKTTLAIWAVQQLAGAFDCVVWQSLHNAPPLRELLREVLGALAPGALNDQQATLDNRLAVLLDLLRERRCLLVLDNVESIVSGGEPAGRFGPGYEGYEQLVACVGRHGHQSCLLLTSREQLGVVEQLALDTELVRSLRLSGLDAAAGQAILQDQGLGDADEHGHALVARYSGNPLALKLGAVAVHDLFGGDTAAFLRAEIFIFDDIRVVIERQFERLSPLERAVLLWLAIEREPLSLDALQANCLRDVPPRAVLEVVRSLQRRSLLERRRDGFTLPHVIVEFLSDHLVDVAYRELAAGELVLLHAHPLVRAQAREYVRAAQLRLLLRPVAELLAARLGPPRVRAHCEAILSRLREQGAGAPSYAAGTILNLLIILGCDLRGLDLSQLSVWEGLLQGAIARELNLAHANLRGSRFTDGLEGAHGSALHPDGCHLVTGTVGGALRFWSTDDWRPVGLFDAHSSCIWAVAFSCDGRRLATASEDQTLKLWDGSTGTHLHTLAGHGGAVRAVAFSPNGATVASASLDRSVRLWCAESGAPRHLLVGHTAMVRSVAFSPDGMLLASGGDDGTVRVWASRSGKLLRVLPSRGEIVRAVLFRPGGGLVAGGGEQGLMYLWDDSGNEPRQCVQAHSGGVSALASSDDATLLASAGYDRTIRIWDGASGELLHVFERQSDWVRSLSFSPDGRILVSCHDDQTMRVWEVPSGRAIHNVQGYMSWVHTVAASPDRQHIISGGSDGVVRVWNRGRLGDVRELAGHQGTVTSVAASPNSSSCASGGQDGIVRVWNLATGQTQLLHGHTGQVMAVAYGSSGEVVASGGDDGVLLLWELGLGRIRHALRGHRKMINAVAFSPDGQVVATASDDLRVGLWDSATGAHIAWLEGHGAEVRCVAFSPCGALVASGGYDHTVRLWDASRAQLRTVLRGHTATVASVAFRPDGAELASGSFDRSIQLWDIASGTVRLTLLDHRSTVATLAYEPDGGALVSGSFDETVRVWDSASGAPLQRWTMPRPYANMRISGATGISPEQRAALRVLGAVE